MPQVDNADLPGLLAHLNQRGILVTSRDIPFDWLKVRQCLGELRACRNPLFHTKPLLIAMDLSILDGYHRYLRYQLEGIKTVPCLEVGRGFEEAISAIDGYSKTYHVKEFEGMERF